MSTNDRMRAAYLRVFGVHLTDKECYAIRNHPRDPDRLFSAGLVVVSQAMARELARLEGKP